MKVAVTICRLLLVLLFAACDREGAHEAPSTKEPRVTGAASPDASSRLPDTDFRPESAGREVAELVDQVYETPDGKLESLLQNVADREDQALRQELLAALYEETRMRPPITRLPLLLEIARAEDAHPSIRTTIMAELGTTLQTDHGGSWADWALALEEHLAHTEGLIRVE